MLEQGPEHCLTPQVTGGSTPAPRRFSLAQIWAPQKTGLGASQPPSPRAGARHRGQGRAGRSL